MNDPQATITQADRVPAATTSPTPETQYAMRTIQFLNALSLELHKEYDWARNDPVKAAGFVERIGVAIANRTRSFDHNGPCIARAWKIAGGKGRPTWIGLFGMEN